MSCSRACCYNQGAHLLALTKPTCLTFNIFGKSRCVMGDVLPYPGRNACCLSCKRSGTCLELNKHAAGWAVEENARASSSQSLVAVSSPLPCIAGVPSEEPYPREQHTATTQATWRGEEREMYKFQCCGRPFPILLPGAILTSSRAATSHLKSIALFSKA